MREFTRRAALTGGAAILASTQTAFGAQANSEISLGIIGTGGRGRYVGKLFSDAPRDTRLCAL